MERWTDRRMLKRGELSFLVTCYVKDLGVYEVIEFGELPSLPQNHQHLW